MAVRVTHPQQDKKTPDTGGDVPGASVGEKTMNNPDYSTHEMALSIANLLPTNDDEVFEQASINRSFVESFMKLTDGNVQNAIGFVANLENVLWDLANPDILEQMEYSAHTSMRY